MTEAECTQYRCVQWRTLTLGHYWPIRAGLSEAWTNERRVFRVLWRHRPRPSTNTTLRQLWADPGEGRAHVRDCNPPTNIHQSRNIKFVDWQICKDMQLALNVARLHFKTIFLVKVYVRMISSESATIFIYVKTKLGQRGKTF